VSLNNHSIDYSREKEEIAPLLGKRLSQENTELLFNSVFSFNRIFN